MRYSCGTIIGLFGLSFGRKRKLCFNGPSKGLMGSDIEVEELIYVEAVFREEEEVNKEV